MSTCQRLPSHARTMMSSSVKPYRAQLLFEMIEVRRQVVDAERLPEIGIVPPREQLGHVGGSR